MDNLSFLRGPYNQISPILNMKKTNKSKPREVTISAAELSKIGAEVKDRALKVVNSAKKGKITIRLQSQ